MERGGSLFLFPLGALEGRERLSHLPALVQLYYNLASCLQGCVLVSLHLFRATTISDCLRPAWILGSRNSSCLFQRHLWISHFFVCGGAVVIVSLTKSHYSWWNWVVSVVSSVKLHLLAFEAECFHWAKLSQCIAKRHPYEPETGFGSSPSPLQHAPHTPALPSGISLLFRWPPFSAMEKISGSEGRLKLQKSTASLFSQEWLSLDVCAFHVTSAPHLSLENILRLKSSLSTWEGSCHELLHSGAMSWRDYEKTWDVHCPALCFTFLIWKRYSWWFSSRRLVRISEWIDRIHPEQCHTCTKYAKPTLSDITY